MKSLLIATRNAHKVGEIRTILGDGLRYLSLEQLPGAPTVVEDAPTFAGNASKKAIELARWVAAAPAAAFKVGADTDGLFVLADDSGLEVDALNGAPGVHSARFAALDTGAAENSSSSDNNQKLLRLLAGVPLEQRTARFKCVLALTPVLSSHASNASPVCYSDEFELNTRIFEGSCDGRIGLELRGNGGFGYDPLFYPIGYQLTFGELSEAEKNALSHRAKALAQLKTVLCF
jgi:XTP/dITP diphosphohydrolase